MPRFCLFRSADAGSRSKPPERVLAGFEERGRGGACGLRPRPLLRLAGGRTGPPTPSAGPGAAYPRQLSSGGLRFCLQVSAARPGGYSLVQPHGGFRGQPAGRPPALLRAGGAAGGDRDPRLQLLEYLLPPRPASGGGSRAAGPGPAHRGGPRALGEAQFRPPALGGLSQEADRPKGGRLRPPQQPTAGQGGPGEEMRG